MGAIGFAGGLAALLVCVRLDLSALPFESRAPYYEAIGAIASWIILPSLFLTLVPGLIAIAVTPAFHDAGWAWIKAATGILVFAGGLHALAPIQDQARLSAEALAGEISPSAVVDETHGEAGTIWVLTLVSAVNVALGVWRPRIIIRPTRRR